MPKNDNKTCKSTTIKGIPCRAKPLKSGYCYQHDPETKAERAENRSKGGRKAGLNKALRKLAKEYDAPELESPEEVLKMLKDITKELYETPTTARFDIAEKARAIAYIGGVILKAYEINDIEERLKAIETEPSEPKEIEQKGNGTWIQDEKESDNRKTPH